MTTSYTGHGIAQYIFLGAISVAQIEKCRWLYVLAGTETATDASEVNNKNVRDSCK